MINIKNKFVYIAAIVLVVVGVAVGTVLILKTSINNKEQAQTQTNATIKTAGDNLMKESAGAADAASAKALLLQAREKYVQINDQDRIGAVDAMIIMVEHSPTTKTTITPVPFTPTVK